MHLYIHCSPAAKPACSAAMQMPQHRADAAHETVCNLTLSYPQDSDMHLAKHLFRSASDLKQRWQVIAETLQKIGLQFFL
jgi:hypothetical protein